MRENAIDKCRAPKKTSHRGRRRGVKPIDRILSFFEREYLDCAQSSSYEDYNTTPSEAQRKQARRFGDMSF